MSCEFWQYVFNYIQFKLRSEFKVLCWHVRKMYCEYKLHLVQNHKG